MSKTFDETLDEMAKLEPDWDSYGADAIDSRAIAKAREILRNGFMLVPTCNGGVTIELFRTPNREGYEIEILPDGEVEVNAVSHGRYFGELDLLKLAAARTRAHVELMESKS